MDNNNHRNTMNDNKQNINDRKRNYASMMNESVNNIELTPKRKKPKISNMNDANINALNVHGIDLNDDNINDWYDFNNKIKIRFNDMIGLQIKQQLPQYLPNGIQTEIMDYITPQASIKSTYYPQINNPSNIDIKTSKYGGKPMLKHNENWPECGICNKLMPLFIQLNVNELPQEFIYNIKNGKQYKNHLIQFFNCVDFNCDFKQKQKIMFKLMAARQFGNNMCDFDMNEWNGNSKSQLIRVINMNNKHKNEKYLIETIKKINLQNDNFKVNETVINKWICNDIEGATEYILNDSLNEYGLDLSTFYTTQMSDFNEKHTEILFKDKLIGHAGFVQQPNYSKCNECGEYRKEMIFQTDGGSSMSNDFSCNMKSIPNCVYSSLTQFIFGDMGVGQIFACENHPFNLDFVWSGH